MNNKPKIYDCFLFYNELELLEIRLNILNDFVDKFVLLESTKTFNNNEKKLYYQNNKDKYKKFQDKIIHIILDEHPPFTKGWDYERYQRNCIIKGLDEAEDDDVIILSDLDEIPNPNLLKQIYKLPGIKVLKLPTFYYYLNLLTNDIAMCSRIFTKKHLNKLTMQEIRTQGDTLYVKDTGWHFSFIGDENFIKNKIENFSHQEFNTKEVKNNIKNNINKGVDIFSRKGFKTKFVNMSNNFPKYILDNLEKYKHLIKQKK